MIDTPQEQAMVGNICKFFSVLNVKETERFPVHVEMLSVINSQII